MRSLPKSDRIMGIDIPRRRFTGWALVYFFAFFCVPLLALCAALDGLLHVVLEAAFGICYGVPCWIG
jgi:hypothetical protein